TVPAALARRPGDGPRRPPLVLVVRARPREGDGQEREPRRDGLGIEEAPGHVMHGDATRATLLDGGQETAHLDPVPAQHIERPCAVLAGAPCDQHPHRRAERSAIAPPRRRWTVRSRRLLPSGPAAVDAGVPTSPR